MMKNSVHVLLLLLLVAMAMPAMAQTDAFGKVDTLYADVARIDDGHWTVTISYTNDEAVVGLSVPIKLNAGKNLIVADSAVYKGGRVADFAYPGFRCDTAIQCVTLGMIANLGPTNHRLVPGNGRLVTVYVSSLEDKPITKLTVDTTTTYPNNTLLVIADSLQGEPPDTMRVKNDKREIIPAWVVRYPKE
ncbi:MAG: hypothetical protein D6800_04295 [Candidatus Zixiibacteriota bacterium]|nr:MAG: hypothetical protein D6800_04295 [candidate division Zixibacteria bacterium]